MKVLQVINSLTAGGAEKLVVDLTLSLINEGIPTDILILVNWKSPFIEKLNSCPEVKVIHLNDSSSAKWTIYNPRNIFKLIPHLKNYEVIHVHLFPSLYHVGLASIISRRRMKYVFTEHNVQNRRRRNMVLKILDRIVYRRYDQLVAISDSSKQALLKHLGPRFKDVQTINNGINLDEFRNAKPYTKSELGFSEKDKLVIQVSSFTSQKDQKTLICSLNHLGENIKLLLVGDGPLRSEQVNFVQSLKLTERVRFLGQRNDVPRLLKSVDVVVLSSYYEGLSLASVEGMISGKPFIASDVPGLSEVVHGAGLLFSQGNHEQLSGLINRVLEDEDFCSNVVHKCISRAENFSLDSMVENYLTVYTTKK